MIKKYIYLFTLCNIMAIMIVKRTYAQEEYLFVGTYTIAKNNSLFVYRFNEASGEAKLVSAMPNIVNPSFFCISSNHQFLYAVSEITGTTDGRIISFHFDPQTGKLKRLNSVSSTGVAPCYIHLDKTGKWLFVANYVSGSLAVFPVRKNGQIAEATQVLQHHGRGIEPQQETAHVHCTLPSPDNKYLLVADLGLDKIFTYDFNDKTGRLTAANTPYVKLTSGTGPRHLLFSKGAKYVYTIQELADRITVFKNDKEKLTKIQSISTDPRGFEKRSWAAEIQLSSDGKFLYASNRDPLNDIVVYSVNQKKGQLTFLNQYSTGGKTLRYFMISPNGKYILVGQQNGDNIILYQRNRSTGLLIPLTQRIPIANVVCMEMIPIE